MNAIEKYRQAIDDFIEGKISADEVGKIGEEMKIYLQKQRHMVHGLIKEMAQVYNGTHQRMIKNG